MFDTIELLMVDDNPRDIRICQKQFRQLTVLNRLHIVKDDLEALRFLRHQGEYAQAILPDVILISVSMRWNNDDGLLMQIKNDPTLAHIPVVILVPEDQSVNLGDHQHINLCVSNPLNLDGVFAIVKHISDFGLSIVKTEHTPNSREQLERWDNEGGKSGYAYV